ncbi:uncharacterized protein STEHIDRAFT_38526, partial [Stereum hirsutum FP-91666 SS1]|uniref:uncharacterized protein n=1 Tax=Stereum hirsutum (strain FP-91666) TaxID=721885 RepID=UPI0004449DF0
ALLIGINKYQHLNPWKNLNYSIADVEAVYTFLTEDLKVPPSNIKRLTASDATRAAILHELEALALNQSIKHDDPILIYYAGHGSRGPPPAEWNVHDAKIEYIVPYDCSKDTPAIPDRTIAACLDGIAKLKGNNITVILDCCNSGSGTRG